MYLLFTSLSSRGQTQHHNRQLADLEVALDVLNGFIQEGYRLSQAWICDEETRLHLPVQALDGTSIRKSLKDMQQQRQAILA